MEAYKLGHLVTVDEVSGVLYVWSL